MIRAVLAMTTLAACAAAPTVSPTERVEPDTAPVAVAPTPLRRLTREEYNNTVRDLLGDTTRPARVFPPDERVGGFESNSIAPITEVVVQRAMDAAEALAAGARPRFDALAPCSADEAPTACASRFIERFGRRVYRRPLTTEERAELLTLFEAKARDAGYAAGVQLVLEAMLESPQFLYRIEGAETEAPVTRALDGFELATRLAFFVWASSPDDVLLDEAAGGALADPAGIERVTRRMLADPRAADAARSFHRQWLDLDKLDVHSKDPAVFPAFTPALKDAMIEETLRFSAHVATSGEDAVASLFTSTSTFVNAPLSAHYGVPGPREGFELVNMPPGQRAGILTHASVMSVHAAADQTSPILRGKFVREKLLCQVIPPPPPDVNNTPPKIDPSRTTKERFIQHRTNRACSGCHSLMDPIGFGFEHYDAIGAWRASEGPLPVDAAGELSDLDEKDHTFDGALELGRMLASSDEVRRCMATQWFRFAMGRSDREEDRPSIDAAYASFVAGDYDLRELVVGIATSHAFRHVNTSPAGSAP